MPYKGFHDTGEDPGTTLEPTTRAQAPGREKNKNYEGGGENR
jgi:hypothetical protein